MSDHRYRVCDVSPNYTSAHLALPPPPFNYTTVVLMVREPTARLISAFRYNFHELSGGNSTRERLIKGAPIPVVFYALHMCGIQARLLAGAGEQYYPSRRESIEQHPMYFRDINRFHGDSFARSSACSSDHTEAGFAFLHSLINSSDAFERWENFVTHRREAMRMPQDGAPIVKVALARLRQVAFVGLTDKWSMSLCVFQRMFGSGFGAPANCRGDAVCEDRAMASFTTRTGAINTGASTGSSSVDELRRQLATARFIDHMDEKVYTRARNMLEHHARRYGCSGDAGLVAAGS